MNIRALRTRLALPMMLGLLLGITVVVLGCGGASTTTTSGGPTGSTGGSSVKTYSNGQYGYSFQYPDTWTLSEGSTADVSAGGTAVTSVGVYDPKGTIVNGTAIDMAQISLYKLTVTIDDSMMADLKTEVENVLSSLESKAGEIKTIEALSSTTVNGMKGFKITYSLTKENAPVVSTLYFLFLGKVEYQLTVQASETNWSAKKAVFDSMVASFKPTA